MNKMKKFTILILLLIVGISIGYALLNTTLDITGKTSIGKSTWSVHFENIQITTGSVEATKVPAIENSTKVDFEAQLNLPGDFYEFTVDEVNSGTIDAMIESITKEPELTEDQKKYLNYTIEYQNGEQIASKQLVKANEFVRLKVRVELRNDIAAEDLPEVGDVLNLGFTLNYVQSDGTGSSVNNNGRVKVATANGSLDEIGTIVTIGTEQFYTIGTEGDNVKLLSVHNLYVGGWYDNTTREWTPYGDEATGMQDENMLGFVSGQNLRKGTTVFASKEKHGTNYSDYEGSIVEGYVDTYASLLEDKYAVEIEEARLITKEELTDSETFKCSESEYSCFDSPYPWIYSTTYWSGSAYDTHNVWNVYGDGDFDYNGYNYDSEAGVRPVIVISKSIF